MENISQKWIDNQNAKLQSQGLVIAKITREDVENKGQYITETLVSDPLMYQEDCVIAESEIENYIYGSYMPDGAYYMIVKPIKVVINHKKYITAQEIKRQLFRAHLSTDIKSSDIYLCVNQSGNLEIATSQTDNSIKLGTAINGFTSQYGVCSFEINEELNTVKVMPKTYIKNLAHSRSFDPMGFELPQNNLKLEVYDYEEKFKHYYENYSGEPIKIEVKYGYLYSDGTNEVIQGGIFHVSKIESDTDNVITFSAVDVLENIKEDFELEISNEVVEESVDIWINPNDPNATGGNNIYDNKLIEIKREDFQKYPTNRGISVVELTNKLQEFGFLFSVSETFKNKKFYLDNAYSDKAKNIIQYMSNVYDGKTVINRNNCIEFSAYARYNSSSISNANALTVPELSVSKQIKEIQSNANSAGTTGREIKTLESNLSGSSSATTWQKSTSSFDFDFSKQGIVKVTFEPTVYPGLTPRKVAIYSIKMSSPANLDVYVGYGGMTASLIVYYTDINTKVQNVISYNTYGEICDVNNPIGAPSDINRIYNYFSNRNIYKVKVRGNPARDVGDFTTMEIYDTETKQTATKNVVILKSNLEFNGVFKEELTIRVIENDFAEVEEAE